MKISRILIKNFKFEARQKWKKARTTVRKWLNLKTETKKLKEFY